VPYTAVDVFSSTATKLELSAEQTLLAVPASPVSLMHTTCAQHQLLGGCKTKTAPNPCDSGVDCCITVDLLQDCMCCKLPTCSQVSSCHQLHPPPGRASAGCRDATRTQGRRQRKSLGKMSFIAKGANQRTSHPPSVAVMPVLVTPGWHEAGCGL